MTPVAPAAYTDAMAALASGVAVVCVKDDRDDVGATVSAFASISADPPIVMLSVDAAGYLSEVIGEVGAFAVSVLAAGHRATAGRFAAEGRPSARLLVEAEPHHRGAATGALVLDEALAAVECTVVRRVGVGDHTVFFAEVTALPPVAGAGPGAAPLVRYGGRYRALA